MNHTSGGYRAKKRGESGGDGLLPCFNDHGIKPVAANTRRGTTTTNTCSGKVCAACASYARVLDVLFPPPFLLLGLLYAIVDGVVNELWQTYLWFTTT